MFRRLCSALLLGLLVCMGPAAPATAANTASGAGLQITPTQQEAKITAGKPKAASVIVANLSRNTMVVTLSVKEFSVANYTYDYSFSNPHRNWITFTDRTVVLQPGKSKTVPFTIQSEQNATPGGYYYTVFASTTYAKGGLQNTVQAASLLYVRVNGAVKQTGKVVRAQIQRVVFGKQIGFNIDALNTGNVYYPATVFGQAHGPFTSHTAARVSHLLIPDKVRRLTGNIPSPLLPGIYQVSFGYTTGDAGRVELSRVVVYLPYWFFAVVIGIILVLTGLRGKKSPKPAETEQTNSPD